MNKVTSRDDLLAEFNSRFKDNDFDKSEAHNKKVLDGIWVSKLALAEDGASLITNVQVFHPDFEILLDKYDAWVESDDDGYFVFIRIKEYVQKKKADFKKSLSFRLQLQNLKI
jgi:hypothetical protein